MSDDRAKTPRNVLIADHLWEALAAMAEEMGSDRDALVNQALYTFARLNGFLLPADLARFAASSPSPGDSGRLRIAPAPDALEVAPSRMPRPVPGPPVEVSEASAVEVDEGLLAEEVAATSMELPAVGGPPEPGGGARRTLVLLSDGREIDRIVKDRFVIGRGKHCDLIINSGKVSREHAAIVREGSGWF